MKELYKELLDAGMVPNRILTLRELNNNVGLVDYIIDKLGQEQADLFCAKYLLVLPGTVIAHTNVKPTPQPTSDLTGVVLTDEQFDLVEDNVKLVGVKSK